MIEIQEDAFNGIPEHLIVIMQNVIEQAEHNETG